MPAPLAAALLAKPPRGQRCSCPGLEGNASTYPIDYRILAVV